MMETHFWMKCMNLLCGNNENMTEKQMGELKEYINSNEFDSDALKQDLNELNASNIYNSNVDKGFSIRSIPKFIRNVQCMFICCISSTNNRLINLINTQYQIHSLCCCFEVGVYFVSVLIP